MACANAVAGNITEPASPAPRVAIAPRKERRSLNADPDLRFSRSFDVIPAPTCRSYPSRFSITEIVYLSIKITLGLLKPKIVDTQLCDRGSDRTEAVSSVPADSDLG